MPTQRTRNAFDDSRSEASSTRDRQPVYAGTAISKGRRNGTSISTGSNLKDVTNAQPTPIGHQGDAAVSALIRHMASGQDILLIATPQINWPSFDTSVLHAYRYVHRLDTPPAFISPYNQRMLTRPGIGQRSPTMARRHARQRISKDTLALTIRKDFNAAIVFESELITSFLYAAQNQGKHGKRCRNQFT